MFLIIEAIKSLRRAKLATLISIITVVIASFLCTTSLGLYFSTEKINKFISEHISIRIFLKDDAPKREINKFIEELKSKKNINKVQYITKKEAADEISKSLGISINELIDHNPLPDAITINFNKVQTEAELLNLIRNLKKYEIVDDVLYEKLLLAKLNRYLPMIKYILLAIAAIFILVSLYMIIVVNRMVIENNLKNYEIMKLVGAKLSTIRMPIILNGILIALFSVIISTPVIYLFYKFGFRFFEITKFEIDLKITIIAYIIFAFILGIVGSIYSSRKISLKFKY